MERKLLKIIMNPAMIAIWVLGLTLVWLMDFGPAHWLWAKIALVAAMTGTHQLYARWAKDFARGCNIHAGRSFRLWNEVPTLLMIAVVILVVVKPF